MDKWSEKVALVTGAGGGIGKTLVESLIDSGMKVVGCDCNVDSLKGMSESVKGTQGQLHIIECNLRKEEQILSMFDEIKQKYGGVDVCINAAGVFIHANQSTGETEKWRVTLEVNVLALSICTREAIKSMKERKVAGHIIHISSAASHYKLPYPTFCMYSASKHAVKSLTESLRVELRQEKSNIRISSISPASVCTNMITIAKGEEKVKQLQEDDGGILLPEDVTSAIIFILSCPLRVQVHDIILRAIHG